MNKKWLAVIGLLLIIILVVPVACGASSPQSVPGKAVPGIVPLPPSIPLPAPAPFPVSRGDVGFSAGGGAVTSTLPAVSEERKIVRNGDMSLIVKSVVDARDQIIQLASKLDGFVVSSFVFGEELQMRGSIAIRVPDTKFEPALVELRKLAVRVESESTNSRDVTEEFIDLQARLKNAEATESQLLTLLNKAQNVEESLKVYEALSQVRREIEQIKGQLQFLERTTSMSLINIQLKPVGTGTGLVPPGWSLLETIKTAIRSLVGLGQGAVTLLVWVALLLPIWGTILGLILWRASRRRKSQI